VFQNVEPVAFWDNHDPPREGNDTSPMMNPGWSGRSSNWQASMVVMATAESLEFFGIGDGKLIINGWNDSGGRKD